MALCGAEWHWIITQQLCIALEAVYAALCLKHTFSRHYFSVILVRSLELYIKVKQWRVWRSSVQLSTKPVVPVMASNVHK